MPRWIKYIILGIACFIAAGIWGAFASFFGASSFVIALGALLVGIVIVKYFGENKD